MATPGCFLFDPSKRHTQRRVYLPMINFKAHATILPTAARTTLTQTFSYSDALGTGELKYAFPLFDGVTIIKFEAFIGKRRIIGHVRESDEALAIYKDAVRKGEAAGVMNQSQDASDIFIVTLGNIDQGEGLVVTVEFLGDLKHDAKVDGTRYTIPTAIAPRYGTPGLDLLAAQVADPHAMEFLIDVQLDDDLSIQSISSPSHPIAVHIGTTSRDINGSPSLHLGHANFTQEAITLDKDFILQVAWKRGGRPRALLERHPLIAGSRALMATFVPNFAVAKTHPEVVFIADRSGSMHDTIGDVRKALQLFLKSIPVGTNFNICSFGFGHELLWEKSKAYSQTTLNDAMAYVNSFEADMGGTELLGAVEAVLETRWKDLDTEIIVLTDGEISSQVPLFNLINETVIETKGAVRIFSLGLGPHVSSALVEGIARSGGGFPQFIQLGENMDTKLVRVLQGALSPHMTNVELEVIYKNYSTSEIDDNSDFEVIDRVSEGLNIVSLATDSEEPQFSESEEPQPRLLYQDDEDQPMENVDKQRDRFAHLPAIPIPKALQAPSKVPTLYPFNRTTLFLLLSPERSHLEPASVHLRADCRDGPLSLTIQVQCLSEPGTTLHQMAARKAVQELEEGRGWLSESKTRGGKSIKEAFPSRYDEIVAREGVRLGIMHQIANKWCSFVALEEGKEIPENIEVVEPDGPLHGHSQPYRAVHYSQKRKKKVNARPTARHSTGGKAPRKQLASKAARVGVGSSRGSSRGFSRGGGPMRHRRTLIDEDTEKSPGQDESDESSSGSRGAQRFLKVDSDDSSSGSASGGAQRSRRAYDGGGEAAFSPIDADEELLMSLVQAQDFSGEWTLDKFPFQDASIDKQAVCKAIEELQRSIGIYDGMVADQLKAALLTAIAVRIFEQKFPQENGRWVLVVEKARLRLQSLPIANHLDQINAFAHALVQ